jgi:hypothetical protein
MCTYFIILNALPLGQQYQTTSILVVRRVRVSVCLYKSVENPSPRCNNSDQWLQVLSNL